MISYKEFYIWLEGYLYGKLENKTIDITPIVEKMSQVKENDVDFSSFKERMEKSKNFQPIEIQNKQRLND